MTTAIIAQRMLGSHLKMHVATVKLVTKYVQEERQTSRPKGCLQALSLCRSLSASATTLTAPPATVPDLNKPPPSHIAISHSAGSLSAAGHEFLSGLSASMHITDYSTSSGALVLGMDSGSHTSLAETVLGQLTCRRYKCFQCARNSSRSQCQHTATRLVSQHVAGYTDWM